MNTQELFTSAVHFADDVELDQLEAWLGLESGGGPGAAVRANNCARLLEGQPPGKIGRLRSTPAGRCLQRDAPRAAIPRRASARRPELAAAPRDAVVDLSFRKGVRSVQLCGRCRRPRGGKIPGRPFFNSRTPQAFAKMPRAGTPDSGWMVRTPRRRWAQPAPPPPSAPFRARPTLAHRGATDTLLNVSCGA